MRSKASSSATPAPRPMNTWRWTGSVAATSGAFDRQELSTGTSRQPSSVWPSSAITSSTIFSIAARIAASCGMKIAPTAYCAGRGQGEAEPRRLPSAKKACGNLHQHAGAVAHQRVGADRAAVRQVLDDLETVLDDPVRLPVVQVDDEADAARVALVARVEQARRAVRTAARLSTVGAIAPPAVVSFPCASIPLIAPTIGSPRSARSARSPFSTALPTIGRHFSCRGRLSGSRLSSSSGRSRAIGSPSALVARRPSRVAHRTGQYPRPTRADARFGQWSCPILLSSMADLECFGKILRVRCLAACVSSLGRAHSSRKKAHDLRERQLGGASERVDRGAGRGGPAGGPAYGADALTARRRAALRRALRARGRGLPGRHGHRRQSPWRCPPSPGRAASCSP